MMPALWSARARRLHQRHGDLTGLFGPRHPVVLAAWGRLCAATGNRPALGNSAPEIRGFWREAKRRDASKARPGWMNRAHRRAWHRAYDHSLTVLGLRSAEPEPQLDDEPGNRFL